MLKKSCEQRRLEDYSPKGGKELDTTESIAQYSRTTFLKVWSRGRSNASASPKMLTKIQVLIQ